MTLSDTIVLGACAGGSAFSIDFAQVRHWKPLLNCADCISLARNGTDLVTVPLGAGKRWIAFRDDGVHAVGFQTTVGAVKRNGHIIGGSNFKVIAKLTESGNVELTG